MFVIGLTGGIASGKSTVARLLQERGAKVIDADKVGHDVISPHGPAYEAVVARFGKEYLGPDGLIDRARLGKLVFSDEKARRDLEAISHPEIVKEISRRLEGMNGTPLAIVDAALLLQFFDDRGRSLGIDVVVVVAADVQDQISRLDERGLSDSESRSRIAAQDSLESLLPSADYVIDNSGTIEELEESVKALYRDLEPRLGR